MQDILDTLTHVGALLTHDHFVGTSGVHFDTYINKDALYPHTREVSAIANQMAELHRGMNIDIVAGPALGGIILSQWTAHHLSGITKKEVLSIYAEKKNNTLELTRGYEALVKNKRVLIVEDLTTTGGSLQQVINTVQHYGGNVVAATVMVNKNPLLTSKTFGVPFSPLASLDIALYEESLCVLCKADIPINTTIGHGKAYREAHTS